MNQTYLKGEIVSRFEAACQMQFDFNPAQVAVHLQFVGPKGKHEFRFRDPLTYSQAVFNRLTGEVQLLTEINGEKFWSEAEVAFYRKTDAEAVRMQTQDDMRLEAVKRSPFFIAHEEFVRSHFTGNPDYRLENPSPWEAAVYVTRQALTERNLFALALAEAIGTGEADALAHWLLQAIEPQYNVVMQKLVREVASYPKALSAMKAYLALPFNAPKDQRWAAEEHLESQAADLFGDTVGCVTVSLVYYVLEADARA